MGVFVVESKATGMLRLLPYELDYDYVELLLQRVERLQPLIRAKEDPPPIPYDRAVCGGCGFRDVCYPAKAFGEGVSVLDDPNLEAALLRRERLKPSSEDYAKVDREVKERLKHEGVKFAIAGEFVIEGKPMAKAAYTVPAHDEIHYTIRRRTDAEIPF
jgi:hypothetical protein